MHRRWLALVWMSCLSCRPAPSPAASACPEPRGRGESAPGPTAPIQREGFLVDPGGGVLAADALDALRERGRAERSTSLLVAVDGVLVVEAYFGQDREQPTLTMSVSKSITALAIGRLVDEGRLELDRPLSETVVPEWKGTDKAAVTLRQLMTHVSGLSTERYGVADDDWLGGSIEAHGLAVARTSDPGRFDYNNQAVDFLAVIARRAHPQGLFMDDQLALSPFAALGVRGAAWIKDGHGQPRASGELWMRPIDLLKVGQLVLQRGAWNGEQLLSEAWIDAMVAPMGRPDGRPMFYGLLWWLRGDDEILAWHAEGWLGQHVVVVPSARLVAVRTRNPDVVGDDASQFGWADFPWDVLALAGHAVPEAERQAFMAAPAGG